MKKMLTGPSAEYTAMYRRTMAAVSEGFCADHGTRLEPVTLDDGTAAGWCAHCRGGWFIKGDEVCLRFPPREACRFILDFDQGEPVQPFKFELEVPGT